MVVQIAALAMLDSLNILTLAIAAFLLGTPRPLPRTLSYIGGTALGYFCAGAMLLQGWRFLADNMPVLRTDLIAALAVAIGIALIAFSIRSIRRMPKQYAFRAPRRIGALSTFLLGAVIGLLYAPTDPRHNLAVGMIASHTDIYAQQLLWLLWYNLFYVLILLCMVCIRVLWPDRSDVVFGWIMQALGNFFYRALPWLVLAAGVVLVLDGFRRLFLLTVQ